MHAVFSINPIRLSSSLAACLLVCGCASLVLSPRQHVVMSALEAMCRTKSTQSLSPFVTDDVRLLLDVSSPVVNVLERTGIFRLSDAIADACQDSSVQFGDEIQVTDARFLVRLSSKEKKLVYEFVVVKERGEWKISSFKK